MRNTIVNNMEDMKKPEVKEFTTKGYHKKVKVPETWDGLIKYYHLGTPDKRKTGIKMKYEKNN